MVAQTSRQTHQTALTAVFTGGLLAPEGRRVIGLSGTLRVLVARADPFSGAVHVFRGKRADRVKVIYWDGTGVCLFAKRREDGKFRWPSVQDGVMRLSPAELSALLEGLVWTLSAGQVRFWFWTAVGCGLCPAY